MIAGSVQNVVNGSNLYKRLNHQNLDLHVDAKIIDHHFQEIEMPLTYVYQMMLPLSV